jgi:hypothetical protein
MKKRLKVLLIVFAISLSLNFLTGFFQKASAQSPELKARPGWALTPIYRDCIFHPNSDCRL